MSQGSSVDVKGDHVECTRCTCIHRQREGKDGEIIECRLHQSSFKNWKKWIAERKAVHENLTRSLNRPAGDLLMNVSDEFRRIQEEKTALEYCKINTHFDKYRGNPTFWKLPAGLADRNDRHLNPVYFAHKTKIEHNEIPIIEHVAIPNYVKSEKNILPCNRNLFTTHHIDKYRNAFSSKIRKIEPHRPEFDELMIIGDKISLADTSSGAGVPKEAENYVADSSSKQQLEPDTSLDEGPRTCVSMNGILFSDNIEPSRNMKINVFFEYTTNLRLPEVRYLKFENKGRTAVRLYWQKSEKIFLFRKFKEDEEEYFPFYFDKNELLLTPEDTIDFPIWFKLNRIGNYSETWEITTKPRIWYTNFKLIVNLQAIVYPVGFDAKFDSVKAMLAERMTNTSVRNVLNDILQYLKFKESETEIFDFSEKDVFESANPDVWSVAKRPKYLYNKNITGQLRSLHGEIKLPCTPKYWDYSIDNLVTCVRKKDIWVYVESQTMDMMRARQRRIDLNTVLLEDIEDQSQNADKETIGTVEGNDADETYSERLETILGGLDRPSVIMNADRCKHFTAYSVIRTYLFKMIDVLEGYDSTSTSDDYYPCYKENVYDIEELPERLIFERFDDIWTEKIMKPQSNPDLTVMPKSKILKGIPITDSALVYKTYFYMPEIEEKKEVQVKSRDTSVVETSSRMGPVKEDFDPFEEEYEFEMAPKVSKVNHPAYQENDVDLDYQKYLIVYTHLTEAVEAMVDALETLKQKTIDVEVLRRLIGCADAGIKDAILFPEESHVAPVEPDTRAEPSIRSLKAEQEVYFQNLLDSHLRRNFRTREYIVEGRRRTRSRDEQSPNYQEVLDADSLGSWLFKSHETLVESVRSAISVEVQTSEADGDFKELTEILSETEINLSRADSGETEMPPKDVFYVIDEEERKCDLTNKILF